eukprot:GHUV01015281.1.p3 GENE.GHUV01015281.1~~GHUV01015281.1.p3  ORF type:complete len:120 (+),score=21.97 GHUV01015281.1:1024-1383(+)
MQTITPLPTKCLLASTILHAVYSCSIVAEAYAQGWVATRWIPGGVGVYAGFLLMAPRLHALGKSRGYMTISEFLYDRYSPPSGATWVRCGYCWLGPFTGGQPQWTSAPMFEAFTHKQPQ